MKLLCPECGKQYESGKFCPECGVKLQEVTPELVCPSCGYKAKTGKFCPECGTKLMEQIEKSDAATAPKSAERTFNERDPRFAKYYNKKGFPRDIPQEERDVAIEELTPFVDQNIAEAKMLLGNILIQQADDEDSFVKAFNLLKESEEAGDEFAYYLMGFLYYQGLEPLLEYNPDEAEKRMIEGYQKYQNGDFAGMIAEFYAYSEKCDYKKAFEYATIAAEDDDKDGYYILGELYLNGWGVEKDGNLALENYKMAAAFGKSEAMNQIGIIYMGNFGVEENPEQSFYWFNEAAKKGYMVGMNNLGFCYKNGYGVEADVEQAAEWFKKSAELGYAAAMCELGEYYQEIIFDPPKAEEWLTKAVDRGSDDAKKMLGDFCLTQGNYYHDIEEDYQQAFGYYQKAAEQGNPGGMTGLGYCYKEGLGVDVDMAKAEEWLLKAADLGDADAQNLIGNIYSDVYEDHQKAFYYYQKAAEQEHLGGMLNLGLCYQDGQGVEVDMAKAEEWLRKAADGGHEDAIQILNDNPNYSYQSNEGRELTEEEAQALYNAVDSGSDPDSITKLERAAINGDVWGMFFYARLYHIGNSVEHDYKLSLDYYTKAADAGNGWAMTNIGGLYSMGAGVKQDQTAAVKWFRKAADDDDVHGMYCLGLSYCNGTGIKQDYSEAAKWLRKAVEGGFTEAVALLNDVEEKIKQQKKTVKKKGNKKATEGEQTSSVKILDVSGNSYYKNTLDINCTIELNGYNEHILTLRHTAKPTLPGRKTPNPKELYLIPFKNTNIGEGLFIALNKNDAKELTEMLKEERTRKYTGKYADQDPYDFCTDWLTIEDKVNGGYETVISYKVKELEINESCKRSYDANLSVFDENNNLLASHNYELTIQYDHKFIGKDEVIVVS